MPYPTPIPWWLDQSLPPVDMGSDLDNTTAPFSSATPYPNMLNPVSVVNPTVPTSYPPQPYNIPGNPFAPAPPQYPVSPSGMPGMYGPLDPATEQPLPGTEQPLPGPPGVGGPYVNTNPLGQTPSAPLVTQPPPPTGGLLTNIGNWFKGLLPGGAGGLHEPMGFFPPGTTPIPGAYGITNPSSPAGGGSFFGGPAGPNAFSLPGATYNLGAHGGMLAPGMANIYLHSTGMQDWAKKQGYANIGDFLTQTGFTLTGGWPGSAEGEASGAGLSGAGRPLTSSR